MVKRYVVNIRSKKILLIADKLLLIKAMRKLHGRFWGVAGLLGFTASINICFLIKPELLEASTAFSDFGKDPRTSPFFVGGVLFAAYGLWRWRNYLSRSFKRPGLTTLLLTLTIIGLYMVAFMPVSWQPIASKLHYAGFILAGVSVAATVLADILLNKAKGKKTLRTWQALRITSFSMITGGAIITSLSTERYNLLGMALIGEFLMLFGYWVWVVTVTYLGEGNRSTISKLIHKIVIIT